MKKVITTIAIVMAIVGIITLLTIGKIACVKDHMEACDGHYEFIAVDGYRMYYVCDTCGDVVETILGIETLEEWARDAE